jgi:hypothetical protein
MHELRKYTANIVRILNVWGYNLATLFRGVINTGICCCKLGGGLEVETMK